MIVNVKFNFGFIFEGLKTTEPRKKSSFNPFEGAGRFDFSRDYLDEETYIMKFS